ncbi:MAG: ATP-binding cassette domain-containing protein [Oscillospiraceae bacterium]|nr:ATP-binding cassette domain-containing protein [Oscillospiraceae bacterium]
MNDVLLEVKDLKVYYPVKTKSIIPRKAWVKAVDGVSFQVRRQEAFGIVGESGCGKSTTGHAIVGLLKATSGDILYEGESLVQGKNALSRERAKKLQIIFQDPYSSLDSRFTVGRCIREPLDVHQIGTRAEREARVEELMQEVGLNHEQITRYPHEFSGGQRQRIGIARALALNPGLIICDEPVSALDVSIQAQILNLMQELKEKHGLTYIFISHNLSVVHHLCDRIAVMYLGNVVEIADKKQLFDDPRHPYTQALLDAIPVPDPERATMSGELEGDVPSPLNPPSGCCFHTRCKYATERCAKEKPVPVEVEPGHQVACHLCAAE